MTGGYDPDNIGGFSNGMIPPVPEILQFHSNGIRNLSFEKNLFSTDTSIQLTQNLVLEKRSHSVCICTVTFIEEIPPFRGKGHHF